MSTLQRGVYVAPFTTMKGETVVSAITSQCQQLARRIVPLGENPYQYLADLWAMLEEHDPQDQPVVPTPIPYQEAG